MSKVILRKTNREKRKLRIRNKISGTEIKPRLSIFRSNKYIYGQFINDVDGKTLLSISLNDIKDIHGNKKKVDAAYEIGKLLAEAALKNNIKEVVFDRSGYKYHGRVESLAKGAREGGLNF